MASGGEKNIVTEDESDKKWWCTLHNRALFDGFDSYSLCLWKNHVKLTISISQVELLENHAFFNVFVHFD